jgi:hypothetical protein
VRLAASRIAAEHRASAVLTTGPNLLWSAPATDITGDVIAALRAEASVSQSNTAVSGPAADGAGQGQSGTNAPAVSGKPATPGGGK